MFDEIVRETLKERASEQPFLPRAAGGEVVADMPPRSGYAKGWLWVGSAIAAAAAVLVPIVLLTGTSAPTRRPPSGPAPGQLVGATGLPLQLLAGTSLLEFGQDGRVQKRAQLPTGSVLQDPVELVTGTLVLVQGSNGISGDLWNVPPTGAPVVLAHNVSSFAASTRLVAMTLPETKQTKTLVGRIEPGSGGKAKFVMACRRNDPGNVTLEAASNQGFLASGGLADSSAKAYSLSPQCVRRDLPGVVRGIALAPTGSFAVFAPAADEGGCGEIVLIASNRRLLPCALDMQAVSIDSTSTEIVSGGVTLAGSNVLMARTFDGIQVRTAAALTLPPRQSIEEVSAAGSATAYVVRVDSQHASFVRCTFHDSWRCDDATFSESAATARNEGLRVVQTP